MAAIPYEQKLHEHPWDPSWAGKRLAEVIEQEFPKLSSRQRVMVVANGLVSAGGEEMENLDSEVPEGANLVVDLRHGVAGAGRTKRPKLKEQFQVLFDDAEIVVVSKAEGVVVQPSPLEKGGAPLVELLKHFWRSQRQRFVNPILVQRLDKETSGLLVLAKTRPAARSLQEQIARRTLERRYTAIVAGEVDGEGGTWTSHLGVGEHGMRCSVEPAAPTPGEEAPKEAVTIYRVSGRAGGRTRLDVKLETGRTHQIRIHCAEAGAPVLGDPVYWKLTVPPSRRRGKAPYATDRMFLHAAYLKFQHPVSNKWLTFRSPVPGGFNDLVPAPGTPAGKQHKRPKS